MKLHTWAFSRTLILWTLSVVSFRYAAGSIIDTSDWAVVNSLVLPFHFAVKIEIWTIPNRSDRFINLRGTPKWFISYSNPPQQLKPSSWVKQPAAQRVVQAELVNLPWFTSCSDCCGFRWTNLKEWLLSLNNGDIETCGSGEVIDQSFQAPLWFWSTTVLKLQLVDEHPGEQSSQTGDCIA